MSSKGGRAAGRAVARPAALCLYYFVYMLRNLTQVGAYCLWAVLLGALYLLFWGHSYRLSPQMLPAERAAALQESYPVLFDRSFSTHIAFLSEAKKALRYYDKALLARYELNTEGQARLVEALPEAPLTFSFEQIKGYRHRDTEVEAFHRAALQQYGGWLVGRKYEDKEAFAEDVMLVAENIRKYGIYTEKSLFPQWEREVMLGDWLRAAAQGVAARNPAATAGLLFGLLMLGTLLYLLPRYRLEGTPGIKHNGMYFDSMKTRGGWGWITALLLLGFYVCLYFYPAYLRPWTMLLDPLSDWLKGGPAGHFFLYGLLYTLAVALMGLRMCIKYRHSAYHKLRTASLVFFQACVAFLLPEFLLRLNKPYFDFKNIWPLDYDFFFEVELSKLMAGGGLGFFMLGWGIALIVLGVPILTYFFGKRWYCSWVCGCGGLAETLGDPYRQLSDKSLKAWKVERWSVHLVLVFALIMTGAVLYTYWTGEKQVLGMDSFALRKGYGFYIGALFSGVVGTGFYPLMGSRVWCRFGCPLAAYLGLLQRFRSRFRITTNGGQCISCGNCSTYCEMGIDVRYYAQRGQPVVRASCVGCGVCASVCPRGVLRLENKGSNRFEAKLLGLSEPTDTPKT